jgi:hypothetical protein
MPSWMGSMPLWWMFAIHTRRRKTGSESISNWRVVSLSVAPTGEESYRITGCLSFLILSLSFSSSIFFGSLWRPSCSELFCAPTSRLWLHIGCWMFALRSRALSLSPNKLSKASLDVLRLLVDAYPESRSASDKRGRTPLDFALGNIRRPASPAMVDCWS